MSVVGFGLVRHDGAHRFVVGSPVVGLRMLEGGQSDLRNALMNGAVTGGGDPLDWSAAQFAPPLLDGARVICVGKNYADHAAEMGAATPAAPLTFDRTHDSLVGHRDRLAYPETSESYDFEGELAVVIGRGGRLISAADAMAHVAGYAPFFDGTARDFQKHGFFAGKNFDHSGAFGPLIAPAASVPDPTALTIETFINGETMQRGNLSDLIRPIPDLIAYVSTFLALRAGDVIATGTPAGVGAGRTPPRWLARGETVTVRIDGVGELVCPIA